MYHIVYRTTNTANNHEYIGVHSTNNVNDGYYGSGRALKEAVREYGYESFTTEHIFFAFSREDALFVENMLVNDVYVAREDTYNIIQGGHTTNFGGMSFWSGKSRSEDTKRKISMSKKGQMTGEKNPRGMLGKKQSAEFKEMKRKAWEDDNNPNKGKDMSGSNNPAHKQNYLTPKGLFVSLAEASTANECSPQTVLNRCNSDKERWNEWKIQKIK